MPYNWSGVRTWRRRLVKAIYYIVGAFLALVFPVVFLRHIDLGSFINSIH